jgi:hypothetical protein
MKKNKFQMNKKTHDDATDVDGSLLAGDAVHVVDDGGEFRDVVPTIALPGDVEVAALVLWESLQPLDQEYVRVLGCPLVAGGVVAGVPRGGEPDARRRVQEDHVSHCMRTPSFSVPNISIYMCVRSQVSDTLTAVPGVLVHAQGLAVGVHAERAELLHRTVSKR